MAEMITVKIDDREVLNALTEVANRARNRRDLMRGIAGDMLDSVKETFEHQGRPRWKPLASSTKRRYAKKGYTLEPTLNRTSAGLFHSIVPKSDNDSAVVGTNKKYAAIQHFGGDVQRAAHMRVLHFDQRTRGKMTHGRPGKDVDHFAKAGKARYAMKVQVKGHSIKIPPRPYMLLHEADIRRIIERTKRYLMGSASIDNNY